MKRNISTSLAMAGTLFCSTLSWGHSAMFPDSFKYDSSNENEIPVAMSMLSDSASTTTCTNGSANGYPCNNVDFRAFIPKADLGGGSSDLNDIWGYTDPLTGKEIALVGKTNGTSFVDITDPDNPVVLGFLPSHDNGEDSWRDLKVYGDYVFIVADGSGNNTHGLQVFDLTELRNVTNPPMTFSESAHLNGFGNAHNIVINEDTGFAYSVGSNRCSGGLYMVDISNPLQPSYEGCFSADGYTHDAQCVVYNGPDSRYFGNEICVGYNEDTITIVDVSNKANPQQISRTPYQGSQYTHQGWFLDENHSILIMNDELDEQRNGINTTSYIYDVSNLEAPVELGRYVGPTQAIDHNLYTRDGFVFETNYRAGLRILSTENIEQGQLSEVAYFDTIPGSNSAQFSGTWSNYPYFESGNIVLSDIGNGLFVVTPDWDAIENPDPGGGDVTETFNGSVGRNQEEAYGPFKVKPGSTFKASITGTNDADLYVKVGAPATTSDWDCRPYKNGSSEECTINVAADQNEVYVMVRGYSRNDSDFTLTVTYVKDGDDPNPPGETVEEFDGSVSRNAEDNYGPFKVTAGEPFKAEMTGSNDADLYVRFGAAPTTSSWDCRPYKNGSNETCEQTVPNGQTEAFVMVRGYSGAASDYHLKVTYK
ncbi:choice-of-anchor B family protein [Hahella ganghwensis]|uniref:choice-of-anchor B family protein n=1 Tax=Hahella ganghwensis TaxID=286420 RepID=UPI00036E6CFB|nr:choice-of-anchor B family protein [Hahella ganghwensis]